MPEARTNTIDWNDLYAELSRPFSDALIKYRVGAISKDKTKAQALPYVDPRAYEDRLNELLPGAWSVEFEPWGEDRLVCRLTIHGVTRSSTGDGAGSPDQIAGTAAEAQALKRACSKFGLGRHLYDLPIRWLAYDSAPGGSVHVSKPHTDGTRSAAGDRASATAREPAPINVIGPMRAATMQRELATLGFPRSAHQGLAQQALGRKIARFRTLSEPEARRVWKHAQKQIATVPGS